MIRHQFHPDQLRIDTTIKVIEKDGTETSAPVVIIVGLSKVEDKKQFSIYKLVNTLFNREFILDKRIKTTAPKKPWWKVW